MKKKFFAVLIMIMLVLFTGCSFGKKNEENKDVSVRYDGDDIIYKTNVNKNTNMVKVYVNFDQAALAINNKKLTGQWGEAGVYEQKWEGEIKNSDIYFLKVGGYTDYRWVAQSNNFVDSRIGESEIFANGSLTFKITSPIDFILNYKNNESLYDGTAYINSLLDKVFKEYTSKIENTEIENISKDDMKEYMIKTLNEENNGIQISDLNVDEIYASLSTNSKLADNSLNKIESTASSSSGKRVYVQNYFYVKEEGGLDKVVSVNYKYKMVINDRTYDVKVFDINESTQIFPGDNHTIVFEAEEDIERNAGDRYELYLGDKKVGKGIVIN